MTPEEAKELEIHDTIGLMHELTWKASEYFGREYRHQSFEEGRAEFTIRGDDQKLYRVTITEEIQS